MARTVGLANGYAYERGKNVIQQIKAEPDAPQLLAALDNGDWQLEDARKELRRREAEREKEVLDAAISQPASRLANLRRGSSPSASGEALGEPVKRTSAEVARTVGLGSASTYERGKQVIQQLQQEEDALSLAVTSHKRPFLGCEVPGVCAVTGSSRPHRSPVDAPAGAQARYPGGADWSGEGTMTADEQHHIPAALVVRSTVGHPRAWVTALAAATLATLVVLLLAVPAAAQASTGPVHCRIGAYVTALHDFDYARHTFAADFWLWSVCPTAEPQPLQTMEFVNANSTTAGPLSTQTTPGGVWSQRKVSGTFRYDWDLTAYPFDRHTLPIVLEEGTADTRTLVYDADTADSGHGPAVVPTQWRVTGFALRPGTATYDTTFGDPTLEPGSSSAYTQLLLTLTIARQDLTSFVKLTFVVYIAFLVSLISYFLNMQSPTMLTARLGVISGALFAVAVNLRTATTSLASEDRLSLVDKIHVVALVALLVDAVAALVTQLLVERGRSAAVITRFDRLVMVVVVISFVAVNVGLLAQAVA